MQKLRKNQEKRKRKEEKEKKIEKGHGYPFGPAAEATHGPVSRPNRYPPSSADNWAPHIRRSGRLQPPPEDFVGHSAIFPHQIHPICSINQLLPCAYKMPTIPSSFPLSFSNLRAPRLPASELGIPRKPTTAVDDYGEIRPPRSLPFAPYGFWFPNASAWQVFVNACAPDQWVRPRPDLTDPGRNSGEEFQDDQSRGSSQTSPTLSPRRPTLHGKTIAPRKPCLHHLYPCPGWPRPSIKLQSRLTSVPGNPRHRRLTITFAVSSWAPSSLPLVPKTTGIARWQPPEPLTSPSTSFPRWALSSPSPAVRSWI
jgi:hypothetical protein